MPIGLYADMELDRIVFDGLPPMCECSPNPGEVHGMKECPCCGKPLPEIDDDCDAHTSLPRKENNDD